MKIREATVEDFKVGIVLIDRLEGWSLTLSSKYDEGIWDTKQGSVVFEREAKFYLIEEWYEKPK